MRPINHEDYIKTVMKQFLKYDKKNEVLNSNTGEYSYYYFPYEEHIYKKIAPLYVNKMIQVQNRKLQKKNIHIAHIHNLSWNEIQLLDTGGSDRFTGMINLYNKYAEEFCLQQIRLNDSSYYQTFLTNRGLAYD